MSDIETLARNHVDLLPQGGLEKKLALGRPLRVKLGIDVTSPDIHIGRAIPLQRMRAFQDAGHIGVLIVGDYTTRIGDPSGRSAERPILSDEQIDANARSYLEQALLILDPERTELRYNGEWLAKLSFADVVQLTRTYTVAQLLERDDFSKRVAAGHPVSVSELLYPLMQAYDSVAVEADVELGGTDQLYNLLAGRTVMEAYGLEPQIVLTTPLLLSWDGAKMSSSVGNNIPLTAAPEEQFGAHDADPRLDARGLVPARDGGAVPGGDAMDAKLALARFIVARSHGDEAAHGRRGPLHARRAGGRRAGGGARGGAARGRPAPPAGAARGRVRALDERRAADDRPGRGEARTGRSSPSSTSRARELAGAARAGREAPVRALPGRKLIASQLTQQGQILLLSTGRPRGRQQNRPCHSTPERPSNESDTTRTESFVGLWRELAEVFLLPGSTGIDL